MILQAQTKYGTVQGIKSGAAGITIFKGIPYAKPPVGELRWKAPKPPEKWNGVRLCDSFSDACIQPLREHGNFYEREFYRHNFHVYPPPWSEDCLYLNIWTPAQSADEKLPVMMWIHGGGFTQGYGHEPRYDGDTLAQHGVILVSINYRLNIFGFFGSRELTEESGFSGNYAILDQIAALQWIHDNIEAFGGDPNNVTMFGQSAGAISVQAIAASPLSKDLVHHAIAQSGAGLTVQEKRSGLHFLEKQGDAFMDKIGVCSLSELRAISGEELMKLTIDSGFSGINAFPVISDGYVLPEDRGLAFKNGNNLDIDYLVGSTIEESQIFPKFPEGSITKKNFKEKMQGWYRIMGESYNPKSDIEALALANSRAGIQWFAEHRSLAYQLAKRGEKPVYAYVFTREPPGEDQPGVFHSACIWYAFGSYRNCWRKFTELDKLLSDTMVKYWTNFAKTGDPNGQGLQEWKPFTIEEQLEMRLDIKCEMYDFADENPEVMIMTEKLLNE